MCSYAPFGYTSPNLSRKQLTGEDKTWFVRRSYDRDCSVAKLVERFSISKSALFKWRKQYENGESLGLASGRPPILNSKAEELLKDFVADSVNNDNAIKQRDMKSVIGNYILQTADDRGTMGCTNICSKTVKNICNKLNLSAHHGQIKTTARQKAEHDVMNALSTYFCHQAVLKHVSNPHLVINYDATQFCIGPCKKKPVCISGVNKGDNKPLSTKATDGIDLNFGIKWFCVINAAGQICSKLVLLLSDEKLRKDECKVHKIPQLSIGLDANPYGYIIFCKTRCGNPAFFHWLNESVLLPYVRMLRISFADAASFAYIFCDGEATQIAPYSTGPLPAKFKSENIIVGKLSAASTAVSQPCDVGNIFKSAKAMVDCVTNEEVDLYSALDAHIMKALEIHDTTMSKGERCKISRCVRKIRIGISRVKPETVEHSWSKAGFEGQKSNLHMKLPYVLNSFGLRKVKRSDFSNITAEYHGGIQQYQEHGCITDAYMREHFNICRGLEGGGERDKDSLTTSRQRCVILNHSSTVARLVNAQKQKDDADEKRAAKKATRDAAKVAKASEEARIQREVAAQAMTRKRTVEVLGQPKKKRKTS